MKFDEGVGRSSSELSRLYLSIIKRPPEFELVDQVSNLIMPLTLFGPQWTNSWVHTTKLKD